MGLATRKEFREVCRALYETNFLVGECLTEWSKGEVSAEKCLKEIQEFMRQGQVQMSEDMFMEITDPGVRTRFK